MKMLAQMACRLRGHLWMPVLVTGRDYFSCRQRRFCERCGILETPSAPKSEGS